MFSTLIMQVNNSIDFATWVDGTLEFDANILQVREGSTEMLCIRLMSATLDRQLSFLIQTLPISAKGEYNQRKYQT